MVTIVALLSVFGLGMVFALLGSVSVKLMPQLKIDQGKFGSLISALFLTCLVASLFIGVITDSLGYKPVAIFGFVMSAFCVFLLANGKSYGNALLACVLLGVGAMAMNTVGNTLIPVVLFGGGNPAGASNLGNVFFGLGLFLTPLLVSLFFRKMSYAKTLSWLALILLVPAVFAILATFPDIAAGFSVSAAVKGLFEPVVLIAGLILFCYMWVETSLTNWIPPFGKEVISAVKKDVSADLVDASAQRLLSLFAIAMMIGRLIASQIPIITEYGSWFIAAAGLIFVLIILTIAVTKSIPQMRTLVFLSGLIAGPCFPTVVGITIAKHPENFATVFGAIFAIGLLGATIGPKAIGNLAKGATVQKGLKLMIPVCAVMLVLGIIFGVI
ncbi:MFS transporter [bacterium]|nr:MFS transporter [bacterium]